MSASDRVIISVDPSVVSSLPKGSFEVLDGSALAGKIKPDELVKLEKQVFDFFTLSQMGKSLLSIQRIDELSHVFLSSVYEASEACNCALFLYDEKDEFFKCVKAIGIDLSKEKEGARFKKEEGLF